MVRQHDATGTDANRLRASSHVTHDDRRCGAGYAGHVVMLGQPVPAVPPSLSVPSEVERVVQRVRGCLPYRDGRKIENGKRYHRNPNVTRETDVATSEVQTSVLSPKWSIFATAINVSHPDKEQVFTP